MVSIFCFCILQFNSFSQTKPYTPYKDEEKFFASAGYGQGRSKWLSNVSNTNLYDQNGSLVNSTDGKFKIKNVTQDYRVEVMAPYGPVRLGLSIAFQNFYLDKLILNSNNGKVYIPFQENFRFDNVGFLMEYPLDFMKQSRFSFNVTSHVGYYGFSKVKSFNFFGGPYLGNTFYAGTGALIDYEVAKQYFLFISGNLEYKRFHNSSKELPTLITHNIYTASWMLGLRVNLYDFKFLKRIKE